MADLRLSPSGPVAASTDAVIAPFKATFYVDPTFTGASTGSQSNPFKSIAAAFAAAAALALPGAVFKIPAGVTVTENVVFPTTGGIWEIASDSGFSGSTTGARITGNITCDVVSGTLIPRLSHLIVTGNITGLSPTGTAISMTLTGVRQNGSITLTTSGTGLCVATFRGIGPAYAGKPGGSNTLLVSVAGQIIANNWVFEGGVTEAPAAATTPYPGSQWRDCQFGSTNGTAVPVNLGGLTLNAFFWDCIASGPVTFAASVANYVIYMCGATLAALANPNAGIILTGTNVQLKTLNGNASDTRAVVNNVGSTNYGARNAAGMYQADFSLTLTAAGTAGAMQPNVIYTDATGTLITAPVGATLNIAGAVGSKLSGSLVFEHNGAVAPIAFSYTGIATPGAMSVSAITSIRRLN